MTRGLDLFATSDGTSTALLSIGASSSGQSALIDSLGMQVGDDDFYDSRVHAHSAPGLAITAFSTTGGAVHTSPFLDYGGRGGLRYVWRRQLTSAQGIIAHIDALMPKSLAWLGTDLTNVLSMRNATYSASTPIGATMPVLLLVANAGKEGALPTKAIVRALRLSDNLQQRAIAIYELDSTRGFSPEGVEPTEQDARLAEALAWLRVGAEGLRKARAASVRQGKSSARTRYLEEDHDEYGDPVPPVAPQPSRLGSLIQRMTGVFGGANKQGDKQAEKAKKQQDTAVAEARAALTIVHGVVLSGIFCNVAPAELLTYAPEEATKADVDLKLEMEQQDAITNGLIAVTEAALLKQAGEDAAPPQPMDEKVDEVAPLVELDAQAPAAEATKDGKAKKDGKELNLIAPTLPMALDAFPEAAVPAAV